MRWSARQTVESKSAPGLTLLRVCIETLAGSGGHVPRLHGLCGIHGRRRQAMRHGAVREQLLAAPILHGEIPRHALRLRKIVRRRALLLCGRAIVLGSSPLRGLSGLIVAEMADIAFYTP